jgi:hypothetical protein
MPYPLPLLPRLLLCATGVAARLLLVSIALALVEVRMNADMMDNPKMRCDRSVITISNPLH